MGYQVTRSVAEHFKQPAQSGVRVRADVAAREDRIFVVDDDPFTLRIVTQMLRLVGYAVETFDTPRAFLASDPFRRRGCAVLDLSMPELTGLDLQDAMAERGSPLSVVFLTGSGDVRSSVRAMKGGAIDFLLKPVDRDELLAAVRRAVAWSDRAWALKVEREAGKARLSRLTPREHEVCELLARGMLHKQIAGDLGTSEATVKVHRARVMEKLEVDSIAELSALLERLRDD